MEQRNREDHHNNHHQGSNPRRPKLAEAGQMATHQSQPQPQQQQPPPPPQKCPRCDSLNTKFCYYNNYSLSQPRYFCKTCRRYWTQGGTLRNVPVGGGCRKGKRPKTSSSTSTAGDNISSRSLQPNLLPPLPLTANQQQLQLQLPPHMITSMAAMVSTISGLPTTSHHQHHQSLMRNTTPWGGGGGGGGATSLYSTAGNLFSSLASMHSLTPSQGGTNHPINLGTGESGAGANLPIFQGFDFPLSMKSQQVQNHQSTLQMHQSSGFQGMVHEQEKDGGEPPFYSTADQNLVVAQPGARTLNSWNNHGGGDNNVNNPNPTFWTNSSGSTSSGMAGSSANAKQWPNLPGFGGASP